MRPAAATLVAILSAALLGGCANVVFSEGPLFTTADARGAPRFKPGVWIGEEPGCVVDTSKPLDQWGDCAEGWVMTRRGLADPTLYKGAAALLAAGDPMILQLGPEPPAETNEHFYNAVRALETDKAGRITAFSTWPVQCGPPPGPAGPDQATTGVTASPLPGLEIRDKNCLARDAASVRAAAKASEAWDREPAMARWVRKGKR